MKKYIIIIILLLVVLLLLPAAFKDRSDPPLIGPKLSELEYTEINFENRYEDLQLSGMLFIPEGEGPFPTAVIIHGSGTSSRDSVWYVSVAKHLQDNGIAVLLPDKRGSEKSDGDWVGANFEELATDTVSAVEFTRDQQIFEYSSIGLIGLSQGGWIAPVAATRSDDVSFVVSLSGAAVTTDEQLLHEVTNDVSSYTYSFIAGLIAPIPANNLKQKEHISALMGFDPIPYWKEVQVPVFFAFGENDKNVPVDASINRLSENNLDHFNVKIYDDGGHVIRDIQNRVNEDFLNDLTNFIKDPNGFME